MKIISGGQTGADRAALDAAAALGMTTGGTAPSQYWTEAGPDPTLRALGLIAEGTVESRTERNVIDADATVIFATRADSPGSALTLAVARQRGKPVIVIDPWMAGAPEQFADFLRRHAPAVLNVAGHRESQAPGIYCRVFDLLTSVLRGPGLQPGAENPAGGQGPRGGDRRRPLE
jgi:hypothetical protein